MVSVGPAEGLRRSSPIVSGGAGAISTLALGPRDGDRGRGLLSRASSPRESTGIDGRALMVVVLLLAAACAVAYLVGDGLVGIALRWRQPEFSQGYLIPAVALYLLWQRRRHFADRERAGNWTGAALFAGGLLLTLAGGFARSDLAQGVGFLMMLGGFGLAMLGRRPMSYAWMPLALLLLALPLPGPLYLKLSLQLQLVSSELGAALLRLLGVSVFLDGNVIDLGVYKLQVAEACSGLRYLLPLASFGVICAWLYRGPLWAKILLCASVVPIAIAMNGVRIALTGLLVEHGSIELAEGFLHLFEGWVVFLIALALLFLTMSLLAKARGASGHPVELLDFQRISGGEVRSGAKGDLQAGVLRPPALVCLAFLALALPVHHALSAPEEAVPDRPGLVTFPLDLGAWQAEQLRLDRTTLNVLEASDYLFADYSAAHAVAPVNLWVVYYDSQVREYLIHSPEECLPGAGWEFVALERVAAPPVVGVPTDFAVNRARIAKGEEQMLMYYWYEQRGRQLTSETWIRFHLLEDAFLTRRSDGGMVRLMTSILPGEPEQVAERRLADFFSVFYPHLQPHVGA